MALWPCLSLCMSTSARARFPDLFAKLAGGLTSHSLRRKYLIGVSGGRDSIALLHALHELGYHKLVVCHLDHGLRGLASRGDAAFVRRRAEKLGYAYLADRAETKRMASEKRQSLELAGRQLRYEFFAKCARQHRCHKIFLAHHSGDQVETVLFNFFRGTGAAGLAGMRAESSREGLTLLRPFLGVSRSEINAYAAGEKITFREDATNAEQFATRNKLRLSVIPAIREAMGASFEAAILRTSEIMLEENEWMESLLPPFSEKLPSRELKAMPAALRRRVVLRWLKILGVPEAGFQETARVLSLLNDGSGPAKVSLPGNRQARRRSGEIFLEKAP